MLQQKELCSETKVSDSKGWGKSLVQVHGRAQALGSIPSDTRTPGSIPDSARS